MYERVRAELNGYLDERWSFVNVDRIARSRGDATITTHLDDAGHAKVAAILADQVEALVPALVADRERRLAAGLPAYGR
jgi:hypothetical protein